MKIVMTAREIMNHPHMGLWDRVCELKGINVWDVNEGVMDSDEEITFSEEEVEKLGLKTGIKTSE